MRVIQCAAYGGPYSGSFVPMLASVAREAGARGYPTTVLLAEVARGRPWLSELDGLAEVRFIHAPDSRVAGVHPTMQAFESALGAGREPAVIHTHFGMFDIPAALMRLRRRRLAVFWHEHTILLDDPHTRMRNTLRYAILGRLVSGILCVSPELRAELRARHAPEQKLHDFPNAIDTTRFPLIVDADRAAARRSLGLPERARVILHFGWSWEIKGGDLMLAAAELLRGQDDLIVLTVLGEDRVRHPGLDDNPIVRPIAPTDDVRGLYAACDVFLSCSRAEGAPLAVLEALACGLPVVATDLPIHRRLLEGLPGAVTVGAVPAAVADGITTMLSLDGEQRQQHAELARARIDASFALDAWARRAVDLYERATGSRTAARSGDRARNGE